VTDSIAAEPIVRRVIIGVDTHKHIHVAVAIDTLGVRLEHRSFPADSGGYKDLIHWG
jgi:transposase